MSEVKKEFLYLDKQKEDYLNSNYNYYLECLNNLVNESEKVLKRELTKVEKLTIKEEGVSFVFEEVKGLYQFPNATEDFNLTALGLDLEPLRKASDLYRVSNYHVSFKNGEFTASQKQIDEIKEDANVYTKSEKQNYALEFGRKMAILINEAVAKGVPIDKSYVGAVFSGLDNSNNEVQVDGRKISVIQ